MDQLKAAAVKAVEEKESLILEVSHKVWEYAELSLKEYKSAALYAEKLREEGFEVEPCRPQSAGYRERVCRCGAFGTGR